MSKRIEYLYRIIKWEHLIDLFETRKLYFSNPREWEDPYESRVDHPSMADVFAQCCGRQGVSDAMWRIYSPNQYGVRVKVRRRTLVAQLDDAKRQKEFKFRRIGPVKYRKQSEIDSKLKELVHQLSNNYVPKDAFDSLMIKRIAFKHEAETRVLLHAPRQSDAKGIRVTANPFDLVETVLADPRMPDAVYNAFRHYLKDKLGFKGRFGKVNSPCRVRR